MRQLIRLKDIADALGVSKGTVSLALRNDSRIAPETRKRVELAAERMGYVPDPALRRLSSLRWSNQAGAHQVSIALVVWDQKDYPNLRHEMAGAARELSIRRGYGFEEIVVSDHPNPRRAAGILKARGVVGVLALASRLDQAWTGFPFDDFSGVEIHAGSGRATGLSQVRPDNFGSMLDAARRIGEARPRSAAICLFRQNRPSLTDYRNEAAALYAVRDWKDSGIRPAVVRSFEGGPDALEKVADWLQRARIEAAVVPNSWIAEGLRQESPATKLLVSQAVEGDSDECGFRQDFGELAKRAVNLLDSYIREGRKGNSQQKETLVVSWAWHGDDRNGLAGC